MNFLSRLRALTRLRARVVLFAEDRAGVQHVEHVEVEGDVGLAEVETLLDAAVE